jgi:hypothetical protein
MYINLKNQMFGELINNNNNNNNNNISYDIKPLMWPLGHIAFRPAINVTR